jgi:hypothetical protein
MLCITKHQVHPQADFSRHANEEHLDVFVKQNSLPRIGIPLTRRAHSADH